MIKAILKKEEPIEEVYLDDVPENHPIFVKKEGKLIGMVIRDEIHGWIIKLGGKLGATGYYSSREDCLQHGARYDYQYFVED